ncbi:MAG TPA: hypothetical protein VJX94_03195 [Stellaceae bacterium]|nr:hypothetical protein [Stellaceae bacterium]
MTPSLTDPRVEFRGFIEAEISKALNDTGATNPIVAEVVRLIAAYPATLSLHVGEPRWPIEAVAMRLTREARTDAFNWPELSMKPQAIIKRARNPHSRRRKVRAVNGQRERLVAGPKLKP